MENTEKKYGSGYDVAARLWCYGELTERGTIANVIDWETTPESAAAKAKELNEKEQTNAKQ